MREPNLDDPDLDLGSLMTLWPATIRVFLAHKMLCVGCMMNEFRTVMDACRAYELDEQAFRVELHRAAGV